MKATVIEVRHPNQYERPKVKVQVRRRSRPDYLFMRDHRHLYDQLQVGDTIEVVRHTNNPYVVPVE